MGPSSGAGEEDVQLRNRQHVIVSDLGKRALRGENLDWLMHDAAAAVADTLGADYVGVFELMPEEHRLRLREGVGWREDESPLGGASPPEQLGGPVLAEAEPVVFGDGDRPVPESERLDRHEVSSGIAVPIMPDGEPRGLVGVYTTERRTFSDADVAFVQSVANVLSAGLETAPSPPGEAQTRQQRKLQESERYRRKLDDIMTAPSLDGEEKIRRLLKLGAERLGLENGHIARIDQDTGRHEIVEAVGSDLVQVGSVTDLEETYCRKTIESSGVTEIANAPDEGWEGDPAYERWNIGCYVGTEIKVDDELLGTLCFVDEDPAEEPFDDTQRAFVNLMGRWIGQEIERQQHTQRLREEKDRFASLVQEVGEYAIFTLDTDGYVRSWNRGAQEIKGYTESEILGRHFSTFYTEEAREAGVPERNLQGAAEYGSIQDEGWRVRADGSRFWANVTITALHDEEGQIRGFAKVTRDMTERRIREQELEREKERFESLVQEVEEYAIFMLDADGRVQSWNEGARQLKGYTQSEIIGRHFSTFYPEEAQEAGVPERNLETAAVYGSIQDEGWRVRADGSRFWANVTITALHDERGEVRGFSKVTRDMTERRNRLQELQREKERFESLVQEVEEYAIFLLDPEGLVQSWNEGARKIKGYTESEILGRHFSTFYTEEAREAGVPERNLETAAEFGMIEDEGWRVRADGSRFWANVTITALHDERGEVRGFSKVTRDMTERRNRERELEESERRHRTLIENFPDGGIGMFDENLRYTVAGGDLLEKLGITKEDAVGQTIQSLHPPQVAQAVKPHYEAALEGEVARFELETGGRELRAQTIPVRNVEGEVYAGIVVFDDITERRRIEAEFEEMLDRVTDAFYALDEEFRFTHVNDAAEGFLQRSEEELLGENLWETFPQAAEIDEVWDAFHTALEEQETTEYDVYFEPLGFWVDATVYPSESGVSVYFRDVTETKRRQRELRESEARFRTLAENLTEIVWMTSEDPEEFLYLNPAFEDVWGIERETVYEEPLSFLDQVDPGDRDRVREAYTSLPEKTYDEEFRVVQPDGEERWVHAQGVPIEDEEGEVFRIVGIAEDVTERREFEARLAESERRHRTLVENFPNGAVGMYDEDLRYTVVGGGLLDDLDIDPDDIVGQSLLDRYPEDVLDEAEPHFRAALEGEANRLGIEFHGRQLLAHTIPVRDAEDRVYAGMLLVQDVTDRKQAEQELRESEALYRTMAENFPDGGVGVFDEDLRYTLVEGTMWDQIEPDAEDLEGNTIWEALPPATAEDIGPIFEGALEGEKGTVVSQLGGRTYRVWATPLPGGDGSENQGLSFALDITDQLERQRELEESRQRYQTLVENFPNGAVTLVDEDLVYRMVGGSPATGAPPEEIEGRPVEEAMPGELSEELVDAYEAAFEGESSTFEHEFEERIFRLRVVPVRDEEGQVFAAMGMSQDVTEAKERERQLEESNERLEQFAYAASHDLQEPLRMVSTYLQLIESRYGEVFDEEGREFFAYAVDGAQRMREMIRSLLEYSRIKTEGRPLEPTDAQAVFDDVISDLRLRIEETDADVTVGDLPRVEADPDQLAQVFRNLLSNALKYSGEEPPRVHVDAERTGEMWRFSVSDEGVGIASEHTDKIFEVFRRLEGDEEGGESIGIGLAICEQIVDRHGGRMWVDSEPGEGSTFYFTMHAVEDRP